MTRRTGRCICGAVRFSVAATDLKARACHCADCRRWAGGPLYVIGPFEDVAYEDESPIGRVTVSEWAERGFCSKCGSGLFWRLAKGDGLVLPVGLLDDREGVTLALEIFTDERLPFLCAVTGARQETRADVIARYNLNYDGDWAASEKERIS